jgi:hypothetical protein
MQNVKIGDRVQFKYHNKIREGRVEETWPQRASRGYSGYRPAGFCVNHGDTYKSYRFNKVEYLAKLMG